MIKILALLLICTSCSNFKTNNKEAKSSDPSTEIQSTNTPKEFSPGELILANDILTKIFDQEMAPLECVPNMDEASLLLRTIRPRMDVVEDDLMAMMDDHEKIRELISTCDQNCTCGHIDEMMRENLVVLSAELRKAFEKKNTESELNRCLNFAQSTFCQSELYKALNAEKSAFSFE